MANFELTFLGTSGMVPTKERNVTGLFIQYKGEGILFDCGEGTQRQMNICGINRNRVTKILVSHWHGDHVGGMLGLIQTIANKETNPKIDIYGPPKSEQFVEHMIKSCIFDVQIDLRVHELDPKKGVERFYEDEDIAVECAYLVHKVPCLGYSIIEKERLNIDTAKQKKLGIPDGPYLRKIKDGQSITLDGKTIKPEDICYTVQRKKLTLLTDTLLSDNCFALAQEADLLICEASYDSSFEHKAKEYKHMIASWAAQIANQCNVKKLVLTHFSQRYKTTQVIEEDARTYFPNVVCAYDFMKVRL
ncbi:ribonuclease Z [Candidatus Woesearchaeota archaeon]|nr:ribonuclease Z [Candidatus Woesearchaeota archaeon]